VTGLAGVAGEDSLGLGATVAVAAEIGGKEEGAAGPEIEATGVGGEAC